MSVGYYVHGGGEIRVPADKQEAALKALKDLNKRSDLKNAGYRKEDGTWSAFSWMPEDYDEQVKSVQEVFELLGFQTWDYGDGTLVIESYDDKTGAEDIFLNALAPYVEPGGVFEWTGEDDEHWRQEFNGASMKTLWGEVVWRE